MASDPEILRHKEWLGFLQPVGLVVSPPALLKAQAVVDRNVIDLQQTLQSVVSNDPISNTNNETAWIADFSKFATEVLGWQPGDLVEATELPKELEISLPDYGEILSPSYGVPDVDGNGYLMLIKLIPTGRGMDEIDGDGEAGKGWQVSFQAKFERLLRATEIPVGLLCNGTELRLVYAPKGESSGHLTFPVQAMCEVSGRLILGAMSMLLGEYRLFSASTGRRLTDLLAESRKYQAEVSTKLANQVLDALWELLGGFQTADAATGGKLLGELATTNPQHIYGGLITTLMRLVFLLYAEDEGLMPGDDIYQRNYAVSGLYERLREDAGNYPDTMDQRYGAWAWLLSLFRLVYDGGGHTPEYLPARHGQLFNPDEYQFLEGQGIIDKDKTSTHHSIPRIPDGVIYRVLEKLLILDGERLSYRSLDVEQIGSVYEGIMGFAVEQAESPSIGVYSKPKGSKISTTVVVDVAAILAVKPGERAKLLKEEANCEVSGNSLKQLKEAKTLEDVVAALGRKVSQQTPNLLPVGALYLQPGEERRRSGSHYTPRALTKPIVETTLRPVLEGLGERPTAEQILSLKVCDLAMGSGAFLVEACRQLAEKVVEAWEWERSSGVEKEFVAPTEEPLLIARRLVAQRCLYGVDKNPFAVNLAKLSLWLVTLAKDLPFTFLDHALKCGDSLVGLTRQQIGSFGRDYQLSLFDSQTEEVNRIRSYRTEIQLMDTRTDKDDDEKRQRFEQVEASLQATRLAGDLKVAAFFVGSNKKQREEKEEEFASKLTAFQKGLINGSEVKAISEGLRSGQRGVTPFNWEVEFPEVFERENSGFDAIVGNPPFLRGKGISSNFGDEYLAWLLEQYPESNGNADLVSYFFRRAFDLLRLGATFGLIATNTISQGDTRSSGLRFICQNGGQIYYAEKRFKWPGVAAVVASIVNLIKLRCGIEKTPNKLTTPLQVTPLILNGKSVSLISAFLFHAGGNENPAVLLANADKSFIGSIVLGMGFTFDDSNPDATPIAEMHRLIERNPKNAERIFPYIGGEEVNSSPTHAHHRYVINFGEMSEDEARSYEDLYRIVKEKVYPERKNKPGSYSRQWWLFGRRNQAGNKAIANCDRVLVIARVGQHGLFTFLQNNMVFSEQLVVFADERSSFFCIMQSRIHEIWARFFSSSMKDDLRYTPSDCFETFPFPKGLFDEQSLANTNSNQSPSTIHSSLSTLETIGKEYYEYRAALMVRNNQGLTNTYNRFHDPEERDPEILKLRQLHEKMDRAVLDAYGWQDIPTDCEFLLDYDDDEDEEETTGRQRKKPWRYRWREEIHDEVLARLLDLNQKRHEEEILGGKLAESKKGGKKKASKSRKKTSNEGTLFDVEKFTNSNDGT